MVAFGARLADREDEHGEEHQRADGQHDPRQAIDDQGDSDRRWPTAALDDQWTIAVGLDEKHD